METPKKDAFKYSDKELVAYCGINCKDCRTRSERRIELAKLFKQSLQELPLELFSKILPPYRNIKQVMDFLEFLPQSGQQTCCTSEKIPCGNPSCEIRICAKNKRFRTCAECADYATCSKLDFLKPHHATLVSDLDLIKEKSLDQYVNERIAKFRLTPIVID